MRVARFSLIMTAFVDPSNSQNRRDGVTFPPYTPSSNML